MKQRSKKRPQGPRAIAIRTDEKLWKSEAQAPAWCTGRRRQALALGPRAKGAVTILLTDDSRMATLNALSRVNNATNVLAFRRTRLVIWAISPSPMALWPVKRGHKAKVSPRTQHTSRRTGYCISSVTATNARARPPLWKRWKRGSWRASALPIPISGERQPDGHGQRTRNVRFHSNRRRRSRSRDSAAEAAVVRVGRAAWPAPCAI